MLGRLVDIFPTLVSLVGLEPLGEFDGRGTDLSPIFSDPARGAAFKNASYTQYPVCTPVGWPARGFRIIK